MVGFLLQLIYEQLMFVCVYLFPCSMVSKSRYMTYPERTIIINMLNKTMLFLMALVIG